MAEPDPFRAEVAFAFDGEPIVLRCSFPAVSKMLPVLLDPPPEVAARRHERLAVNQRAFGREIPALEEWSWNQHLLGATAAHEVEVVARCIAILAEEHHPDVTFERVMEVSPGWGQVAPAFSQLIYLHHYHPGEAPQEVEAALRPFATIARLQGMLSRLPWRTGSPRPSSAR